jgi:hypothetical protein
VSRAKTEQRHKYGTRTVQIQKNKPLKGQNKNNMAGKIINNNNNINCDKQD